MIESIYKLCINFFISKLYEFNEFNISINPPETSCYSQEGFRNGFNFSRVFRENTSQQEFLQRILEPFFEKIIGGENLLLFSYGLTNSDKTHTIYGIYKFFIFSNIDMGEWHSMGSVLPAVSSWWLCFESRWLILLLFVFVFSFEAAIRILDWFRGHWNCFLMSLPSRKVSI